MAARSLVAGPKTLQRDVVKLYAKAVGAGAANLTGLVSAGRGVVSINETGTGLYTVTLSDKWSGLLMLQGTVIDPTAPDDWIVQVAAESVSSAKTINIQVYKGGVLADLSSDETLMLEITLRNTAQLV